MLNPRPIWPVLFLLLFFGFPFCSISSGLILGSPEAEKLLGEMARQNDGNDPAGALRTSKRALSQAQATALQFVLLPEIFMERGRSYHLQNNIPQALAEYGRAISLWTEHRFYIPAARAYYIRSALRREAKDERGALLDVLEARRLKSWRPKDITSALAKRYGKLWPVLLADLKKAAELDPFDPKKDGFKPAPPATAKGWSGLRLKLILSALGAGILMFLFIHRLNVKCLYS